MVEHHVICFQRQSSLSMCHAAVLWHYWINHYLALKVSASRLSPQSLHSLPEIHRLQRTCEVTQLSVQAGIRSSTYCYSQMPGPLQLQGSDTSLSPMTPDLEIGTKKISSRPTPSLPPEILSCIFRQHRDSYRNYVYSESEWPSDDVLPSIRASHVSVAWRAAALSDASLWTTLVASSGHSGDFFDEMLHRSEQLLLDIVIRTSERSSIDGGALDSGIILAEKTFSYAHRLHSLRIKESTVVLIRHLKSMHALSAPHMVHLSLEGPNEVDFSVADTNPHCIFTGGAGSLAHFESNFVKRHVQPPLDSINSLMLISPFVITYSSLSLHLSQASHTITFLRIGTITGISAHMPSDRLVLPALKTMAIAGTSFDVLEILLAIKAPSMATLKIYIHRQEPATFGLQWYTLDSYPRLCELRVSGWVDRGMLAPFPGIAELTICNNTGIETDVKALLHPGHDSFSTTLPALRTIRAPAKYEMAIQEFCAARQFEGLGVPEHLVLDPSPQDYMQ